MKLSDYKLIERDRDNFEKGFKESFVETFMKASGKCREDAMQVLILTQHRRGLCIEYIAEINELHVEYVRDVVKSNEPKIND